MGFSVPLVSLVSGFHLSFSNCQPDPSTPSLLSMPISFPFMFLLHTTPKHSLSQSHQDITLLSIPLAMEICNWISPITFFFFSCLWFTCCAAEDHSANAHLLQLIFPVLLSPQYCPRIFYKSLVGLIFLSFYSNCSSIKPLPVSLNPHLNAVLLKSPPSTTIQKSFVHPFQLSSCPRRRCILTFSQGSTCVFDPFPSQLLSNLSEPIISSLICLSLFLASLTVKHDKVSLS